MNRRQLLARLAGSLAGGFIVARRAAAQQPGVTPLTGRLSLVATARTNVLALTTPEGLVIVDSGAPEFTAPLTVSLGQAVRTVFNTHYHVDNTGANEVLRRGGADIVAHENTRIWMATPVWNPAEDRYRPARAKDAHPNKTFRVDGSIAAGAERIDYGYLIEAHTSGDIYVFFRDANVLAVGDVASPVNDPSLDYFTGAWIGGRVDALSKLVRLCDDRTRVVPGYGPVMNKASLTVERDMMKKIYDRTVDRVREGDYVDDMLKKGVMDGLARTWTDPKKFLYDVHKGLWAHHNKLNPNVV
jgi:glyoxylase-like metal-dependent hydrolase (beta-lactamase superfamily II)